MSNKEIGIYILLIFLCLWVIFSEFNSSEEDSKYDDFTKKSMKINGRFAFYSAIIGLITLVYLIYHRIKEIIE